MKVDADVVAVPFHQADLGEQEAEAAADVVRSGWLTMGPRTVEFEQRFSAFVGARHAVAVNSCTAALHLALEAIGIQAGDEVLVPTNTFTATAEVVTYLGARPVLVDIDRQTLSIDPADAERRITPRTKAILPVHFAGQPCDMDEIHSLAAGHGMRVIEDAAHALPAAYKGRSVGALSETTCFSFYATKTLTTGEGGMLTTDSEEIANRARIMRLHGIGRDAWKRYAAEGSWYYQVWAPGFKYNMTDIQAAIGMVQLAKCTGMRSRRAAIVRRYDAEFGRIPALEIPVQRLDRESAHHLYVLRLDCRQLTIGRDQFITALKQREISASVHFIPLHLHPYYRDVCGFKSCDYPVATGEFERYLSLPLFSGMTEGQIEHVITSVCEIAADHQRSTGDR